MLRVSRSITRRAEWLQAGVGRVSDQPIEMLKLELKTHSNSAFIVLESPMTGHCKTQSHCLPEAASRIPDLIRVLMELAEGLCGLH